MLGEPECPIHTHKFKSITFSPLAIVKYNVEPLRGSCLMDNLDPPIGAARQSGATNIEPLTGFMLEHSQLCARAQHAPSYPGWPSA